MQHDLRLVMLHVALAMLVMCRATASAGDSVTAETLTDAHVRAAISTLIDALYERKDPARFWEPVATPAGENTAQGGGYTALVVLALLEAGESYQDPRLRDAIEFLEHSATKGTYAVSLRTAIWARLPEKFRPLLERDAAWLASSFSHREGGWTYGPPPTTTPYDNSTTQFGALGLWEASKRGIESDKDIWRRLEERMLQQQQPDGGWNYRVPSSRTSSPSPVTGSMTAAGLATLYITDEMLHKRDALDPGTTRQTAATRAISHGLRWMDGHFAPDHNPGRDTYFYYYLRGVERVGLASGRATFGGHDWFAEGATELIHRLCAVNPDSGAMTVHSRERGETNAMRLKDRDLAFALMFLSRGRVPIAVNKLQIDGAAWDNRPRDVANLTTRLSRKTEKALAWQTIDLNDEPDAMLGAPLLYLASNDALPWLDAVDVNPRAFARQARQFIRKRAAGAVPMGAKPPARPSTPDLDRLKAYLDRGGFLLALNEGQTKAFAESIEGMGFLLYPQYSWRTLPPEHWAYTLHTPVTDRRPVLRGLSNGVRELIVLSSRGDLPRSLQAGGEHDEAAFSVATNVYLQASEMNRPRPRLPVTAVTIADPDERSLNGVVREVMVVRAVHEGNWKPEPAAMTRLANAMMRDHGVRMRLVDRPLAAVPEMAPWPALVIVQGIDAHDFSEAQRMAIQTYVGGGGIILFETPGGCGDFTRSAETTCTALFGGPPRLLDRHPVLTGVGIGGATDHRDVSYRPYSQEAYGIRGMTPRLRGLDVGGDIRVLFSREDLSHALLDQPCWGINGYAPESAHGIMTNIVLYSIQLAGANDP